MSPINGKYLWLCLVMASCAMANELDLQLSDDSSLDQKNTCAMTQVLQAMTRLLTELSGEIRDLKRQVGTSCKGQDQGSGGRGSGGGGRRPRPKPKDDPEDEEAEEEEEELKIDDEDYDFFKNFGKEDPEEEPEEEEYNYDDFDGNSPAEDLIDDVFSWFNSPFDKTTTPPPTPPPTPEYRNPYPQQPTPDYRNPYGPPAPDYRNPYETGSPDYRDPYGEETPDYRNPYQPETPDYRDPYQPETPDYRNPYQPEAPDYRNPYQPEIPDYRNPYGPPSPPSFEENPYDNYDVESDGVPDDDGDRDDHYDPYDQYPYNPDSLQTTTRPQVSYTYPPEPTECESPFELQGGGCYLIFHDNRNWRSWGEANAFCQSYGGQLASPWRMEQLQNYLTRIYSHAFWVGAMYEEQSSSWKWLTGREVDSSIWKPGQPQRNPGMQCVFLDKWSGYRANNYFCGEKYPFICEYTETVY